MPTHASASTSLNRTAPHSTSPLATWSVAGLAFALYTAANLAPRAVANHAWYRERFPDYPARRRALVPYVL